MFKKVFCCALSLLGITACSVKQERVSNEPPVIAKGIQPFGTAFGSFVINQASVFMWPDKLSEEEIRQLVRKVKAASLKVDAIKFDLMALDVEARKLSVAWESQECVAKWSSEYDEFEEQVTGWKSSEIPEEQAAIKACTDNQTRRLKIVEEIAPKAAAIGALSEEVDRLIDPNPEKPENKLSINDKTSILEIKDTGESIAVNMKLSAFQYPSFNPSTENGQIVGASFDLARRLLSFAIPEVNAELNPTGRMFVFLLERSPDQKGMARFTGDIRLMDGDKIVRYGSGQFDTVAP